MDEITLAYIAGAMDSDGYFTIKRNTYSVRVIKDSRNPTYSERCGIKQTSPEIIDLIHSIYGGYRGIEKPNAINGKPLHSVLLTNKKCVRLVNDILPYLRIKKRQAEILLELRKTSGIRSKATKVTQLHKSGKLMECTKYSVSDDLIQIKENFVNEIKSLNDSRSDPKHQPLPWRA